MMSTASLLGSCIFAGNIRRGTICLSVPSVHHFCFPQCNVLSLRCTALVLPHPHYLDVQPDLRSDVASLPSLVIAQHNDTAFPISPVFYRFHSASHTFALLPPPVPPVLPTHSTSPLAYSIGTPLPSPCSGILHVPVFSILFLNNLPPSPTPTLSSSQAAAIELYCLSNSSSRARRRWEVKSDHARCIVQCRRARLREKRRGRGVRVAGWLRKWRIRAEKG